MTLYEKFQSLRSTFERVVKDKKIWATEATMQDRLRTCEACDKIRYCYGRTKKPYCTECGCSLFGKTLIHGAACPIGRW